MKKQGYAVSALFEKQTAAGTKEVLRQMVIFDANSEDEAVGHFLRVVMDKDLIDYSIVIKPVVSTFYCYILSERTERSIKYGKRKHEITCKKT